MAFQMWESPPFRAGRMSKLRMPLFLRALMAMLLATLMSTAMAAQAASDTIDPDAPITTASAASPAVPAASTPVVTRATIKFELLQAPRMPSIWPYSAHSRHHCYSCGW